MSDFTIFLKYLVTPSGFLKDIFIGMKDLFVPKRLSIIFIFIAVISSILLPYNQKIVAGGFLFLALYMQFRIIYKAGEHNRWRNEIIKKVYAQKGKKKDNLSLGNPLENEVNQGKKITESMPEDTDTHPSENQEEE